MNALNKRQLSLAVSAALATTLTSGLAFGQDEDDTVEEVIVTGTRIATTDGFGATSPVTVVDAENIKNLGFVNIEQVLNSLPSIETSQNANISNGSSGTASIDLRGLGTNRTLVLINGRRMQAGGAQTQAPDVGQIPTIALERVDVLTGGASATYGADAVAGVVNFVTRKMDGIEIRAGWSGYRHDNDNAYIQGLMDRVTLSTPLELKALMVRTIKSTSSWVATSPTVGVTPLCTVPGASRKSCVKNRVTSHLVR